MAERSSLVGSTFLCANSRSPPDSDTIFKLSSQVENEDAEGLLARNVPVTAPTVRRSVRMCAPVHVGRPVLETVLLSDIEERRLSDLPSLDDSYYNVSILYYL